MGWPKCNQTAEFERIEEKDIWHGMEFHHFGLILSALFGLIAIVCSAYLIWRHATHYLKPWEQRHIIRVLFMVPIYSIVSFVSYLFYRHAVYFEVIRDCYEAFAIASFFSLLCNYIAPDLRSQKDYFRGVQPRNWILPINWFQNCCGGQHGIWRTPRSGLTWFNVIWFGVFQYCFIRVFMTLVALVTEAAGLYCLESLNPAFAHIWVMIIEGGCVTIAMYCLIQFYIQLKGDLAEHRPLLKITAIKLVIFLSFWQNLLISFLTSSGAIKASPTINTPDIKVGIPSMLLCIEMALFSILHLWAFPWKVYDVKRSQLVAAESAPGFLPDPRTAYQGGPFGVRALADAFNPWDLVKAVARSFRWIVVGRKHRMEDRSYQKTNVGTGLEPTRNQFTAFNSYGGSNPYDEGGGGGTLQAGGESTAYTGAASSPGKPAGAGRYAHLTNNDGSPYDEEDEDALLSKPQSNPTSAAPVPAPYPRPMERLPTHPGRGATLAPTALHGDISAASIRPPTSPLHQRSTSASSANNLAAPPYPLSPSSLAGPGGSNHSRSASYDASHDRRTPSMESQKTQSTLTPDVHPLGPAGGRQSAEQEEWEQHDGYSDASYAARGESERGLGGGDHGVRDNRF